MKAFKLPLIYAIFCFTISFLIGILFGVRFSIILIRSLMFFIIGISFFVVIVKVLQYFIPESKNIFDISKKSDKEEQSPIVNNDTYSKDYYNNDDVNVFSEDKNNSNSTFSQEKGNMDANERPDNINDNTDSQEQENIHIDNIQNEDVTKKTNVNMGTYTQDNQGEQRINGNNINISSSEDENVLHIDDIDTKKPRPKGVKSENNLDSLLTQNDKVGYNESKNNEVSSAELVEGRVENIKRRFEEDDTNFANSFKKFMRKE